MRTNTSLVTLTLIILAIALLPNCQAQIDQTKRPINDSQGAAPPPMPQSAASPAGISASSIIPIIPLIIDYQFSLKYFMQPLNDNPDYSIIEAYVLSEKPPVYQIALTGKQTKRPAIYCNSEGRVNALKRNGQDARLAQINFKTDQGPDSQAPTYEFSFVDSQGQSVVWRFVLASAASERGVGLTALGNVPGLKLSYRGNGTTAGEGTAVQIGTRVSEAEPWPEISAPPYFVAYHGFYTERMDSGVIMPGNDSWQVVSAPKDLTEGAVWTFTNDLKVQRQLQIAARRGDEVTIAEVNNSPDVSTLSLIARATPQGLFLRVINVAFGSRNLRMTFKPELPLTADAPSSESEFTIDEGDHERVSAGTVSFTSDASGLRFRWQPKSPDWAKTRLFTSTIKMNATGYSITVQ